MTDAEIKLLITLPKQVVNPRARRAQQRGSAQLNYKLEADSGERFLLFVRQNLRVVESFSCGLTYLPTSGEKIPLMRCNGSDHTHSNPLDSGLPLVAQCHIHRASERYLNAGYKIEHFAVATTEYKTLEGALGVLVRDCKILGLPQNDDLNQLSLI